MKLEKYQNKSSKKRKVMLISLGVIVLVSISFLLFKTFASFKETTEFPIVNGKVDYFGNSDVYFAFYKGDEQLDTMPVKDNEENLVFDYGSCDNGASIEWNESEWAPLVKGLVKNKTKCSLHFKEYIPTFDEALIKCGKNGTSAATCFKTYVNLDTTNLIVDDTKDANIRYIGKTPQNYIDIGDNELWRIIGVMNNITSLDDGTKEESLLKIIRAESIGNYSWDTSAAGINGGYGINEWSQADVMKLLNPKELYSDNPTIGGSLYWTRGSGNCYNGSKESQTPCTFTNSGIQETAKNKIAKVRWNTGTAGAPYMGDEITAKYMYDGERSSHNGKEQCTSCNDPVTRTTTWDGYIGLIYPSDFGYAVDLSARNDCLSTSMHHYNNGFCNANNWLKPATGNLWTITSAPYSNLSDGSFNIGSVGAISGDICHAAYGVAPVAYLKSSIKIVAGTGDINSPFQVSV